MKKKNKASAQDTIFNNEPNIMQARLPHAEKDRASRVIAGRGFGKTVMVRIINGVPTIVGNKEGIKLEEEQP